MKLNNLSFLMLAIVACIISFSLNIHAMTIENTISTVQLKAKLDNGDDICLVNVLPKIVHDDKHIPGSINIPLNQIMDNKNLPDDMEKLIIFYCMGFM